MYPVAVRVLPKEACVITRSLSARPRLQERGQILPLVGIMLVVIISFAALAVDVGTWRYQQRIEQSAADSAAIAGASEEAFPPSSVKAAATKDATANGFTDNGGTVRVTVNNPPATGPNTANSSAVEVLISGKQPLFFANVIPGFLSPTVTVRAVALINTSLINCVIALDGELTDNGLKGNKGGIKAHTCGVATNNVLDVNGQANIDARSIGCAIAGKDCPGTGFPEAQAMKSVQAQDPCLTIPGCGYITNNLNVLNSPASPCLDDAPVNFAALQPGRYCHPQTFPKNQDVVLVPTGNRIFVFDSTMPSGNIVGSGVTVINVGGTLSLAGNKAAVISAPDPLSCSCPSAGMAYYQPLSNTNTVGQSGNAGTLTFSGGFYAPGATVILDGSLSSYTFLVAKAIDLNGAVLSATGLGSGTSGHAVLAE